MRSRPFIAISSVLALTLCLHTAGCEKKTSSTPAAAATDFQIRCEALIRERTRVGTNASDQLMAKVTDLTTHIPPETDAEARRAWESDYEANRKKLYAAHKDSTQYRTRLNNIRAAWQAVNWEGYVIPDDHPETSPAALPLPPPRPAGGK